MTKELKFKIGQMIAAGFPGAYVDEHAKTLMDKYFIGNFFIFARNYENAEQICSLTNELHRMAYEKFGIAPLISIDQEGGAVSRITEGAALFPGAMAQGAAGGKYVYDCAKNCAEILRFMGINTTASPVMDVNIEMLNPIIGSRAFSDNPDEVAGYGIRMMEGFRDGGVIATVKHYPGHGNVSTDSHLALPVNNTPAEKLFGTEFMPFEKAFGAGADLIMSAHVMYTALDEKYPATLSKTIATDILRDKHGFKGVAMTDCMEMNAIKEIYGSGEGAVRAIEAGMDLFTVSHTLDAVDEIVNAIYRAVEEGRITEERINLSYERIKNLKSKYGLDRMQKSDAAMAKKALFREESVSYVKQAARASVTCLSGDGSMKELDEAKNILFLAPRSFALSNAEEDKGEPLSFAKAAANAFGGEYVNLPLNEYSEEAEKAVLGGNHDAYMIGLYNARFREGQKKILSLIEKSGKPVFCVLLGAPYDLPIIENARTVLCAYEYTNLSVPTLIDAIREKYFPGALPVRIRI